jgi:hypothetical protein
MPSTQPLLRAGRTPCTDTSSPRNLPLLAPAREASSGPGRHNPCCRTPDRFAWRWRFGPPLASIPPWMASVPTVRLTSRTLPKPRHRAKVRGHRHHSLSSRMSTTQHFLREEHGKGEELSMHHLDQDAAHDQPQARRHWRRRRWARGRSGASRWRTQGSSCGQASPSVAETLWPPGPEQAGNGNAGRSCNASRRMALGGKCTRPGKGKYQGKRTRLRQTTR